MNPQYKKVTIFFVLILSNFATISCLLAFLNLDLNVIFMLMFKIEAMNSNKLYLFSLLMIAVFFSNTIFLLFSYFLKSSYSERNKLLYLLHHNNDDKAFKIW